jgi:hypothetical protein
MGLLKQLLVHSLAVCLILAPLAAHAEAVDDKFTQISPQSRLGGDEFVHGSGYGKILMRVMVFGAVPKQGIHYFPEGTDMLFALLYAGGYSETTKLNGITIRRRSSRELIKIDLEDLMADGLPIPKLIDGDVVNVPFNWRKSYQEVLFYTGMVTTLGTLLIGVAALISASKK